MEIKKVILDRSKLSSTYIEQKQDFNHVLTNVKLTKTPTWKSPWFYGAVGLSSVAITALSLSNFSNENNLYEKKATLEKDPIIIAGTSSFTSKKKDVSSDVEFETEKELSPKKKIISTVSPIENQQEIVKVNEVVAAEVVNKMQNHSALPSINGIFNGNISKSDFQISKLIESNSSVDILSYKVQYYNGSEDVEVSIVGNNIPLEIVDQISTYNNGQMIFFTEIKGVNNKGEISNLPSMNFKLID